MHGIRALPLCVFRAFRGPHPAANLGKMYQLFGDRVDPLIAELNKELTA
jgi:hypothetical protein